MEIFILLAAFVLAPCFFMFGFIYPIVMIGIGKIINPKAKISDIMKEL